MGERAGYGKSGRHYRASGGDLGGEKLGALWRFWLWRCGWLRKE